MLSENVDPHDSFIEVRIGALDNVIVKVLLISKRIHALENEIKKRLEIFRTRACDEDV
jgi:hypothetical protein